MAANQTDRYRCLAVLVSSYRTALRVRYLLPAEILSDNFPALQPDIFLSLE